LRRALVLLLATLALLAFGGSLQGCRGCGARPEAVARLAELRGAAVRSTSARPDAWADAVPGVTFSLGDAVRTRPASSAKVDLTAGGALRLGENTLVRFLAKGPGASPGRVGVETGEAEVETGGAALEVETLLGAARFEPSSRVRVTASGTDARFEVLVGRAEIEGDGGTMTLGPTQSFVVTSGRAILESSDAGVPDAAPPELDASASAPAGLVVEAEVHGAGVRTGPPGKGPLTPLAQGRSEMLEGARLLVPDGASVVLSRGAERAMVVGQAEVVVGRAGGPLLESRGGRVVLTSPSVGTRIDVPGGSIVLAVAGPGSRQAQVVVDHRSARVVAEAGQVELRGRMSTATLGAGQGGSLDDKGLAQADANVPTAADVTVPSGESSVIHSPRGAAAVRIRFDGVCPGDALVEVVSGKARRSVFVRGDGPAAALVALGLGSHTNRVRCVDADGRPGEARPGGSIQVVRDSGAQPVPRTAPSNFVDADGRRYSVLYQNLLPQITARWPRAPSDRATVLHLEPAKGPAQVIQAPRGTAAVPPGAIVEGEYRFWFEAEGDPPARSPETTLRVAFDNAAPAAEVQLPAEGQAIEGVVHVAGVAVEGAAVSVDGVAIPLDPAFRFRGDVPAPTGEKRDRSIAVRIAHPSHGVHYYLRTIGGA
jgi:hypothetical protein